MQEFTVALSPKPAPVSPFLSTRLGVIANDQWVALIPVSTDRTENGTVTLRFRVTAQTLALSFLEIHLSAYAPVTGDTPKTSIFARATIDHRPVVQIMGGTIYRIDLRDFAAPPSSAAGSAAKTP
jgi:hypothetical protein